MLWKISARTMMSCQWWPGFFNPILVSLQPNQPQPWNPYHPIKTFRRNLFASCTVSVGFHTGSPVSAVALPYHSTFNRGLIQSGGITGWVEEDQASAPLLPISVCLSSRAYPNPISPSKALTQTSTQDNNLGSHSCRLPRASWCC